MIDREKVIRGLGEILVYCHEQFGENDHDVQAQLTRMNHTAKDAIELLKAQEPVEPKLESTSDETHWYSCECGTAIDYKDAYCRGCGRPVKWE